MENRVPDRLRPPLSTGLTAGQVANQKEKGLQNIQPQHQTKTVGQIFRDNILTLFNAFNFGLAVCIAAVGEYENLLFMLIVLINIAIGIVQEIRSKRMVENLSLISMPRALVIRDGEEQEIAVEELVLDDVTVLRMGKQICADALVADGEVEVNESLLTGEAEPVLKKPGDMLLSGSYIVSGKCLARVEHIGADNYAAKIALSARKYKKVHSSLMNDLNKIVKFTGFFILPLGALLFLHTFFALKQPLNLSVTSTAAALLGMLPKGLVLLTSVSLMVGVIKLARKKTLVQELFCIETLSRVDILCLDKTGTITEGRMSVTEILPINNVQTDEVEKLASRFVGAMEDNNATFLAMQERFAALTDWKSTICTPFSSARKWSAASFEGQGTILLGAPEVLLQGTDIVLPPQVEQRERDGCRVLLLARSASPVNGELPADIQPVAVLVLLDPIRSDARETLEFFAAQDVELKIISGDNPVTVSSIARQAGLAAYDAYVDASTLEDEEALEKAAAQYTIFGRVSPVQKQLLVHALQRQGHTVAMTGDGVNDVLALKDADCSIAMAAGSDAARQISQLVLLDSNFSSLPSVVMEGRRVINNITRTASLFLVKTIFSFLLSFLALVFAMPYPFLPIQLSLIGTVAEGIPAFFLTFEPNHERIKGNFLATVLYQAFPCALAIVLNIVAVDQLAPLLSITAAEISTLCVYLTGFIWLAQLFKICMPLSRWRLILWVCMVGLFTGAVLLLPGPLSLCYLRALSVLLFVLLAVGGCAVYYLLSFAADKVSLLWNRYRRRKRQQA